MFAPTSNSLQRLPPRRLAKFRPAYKVAPSGSMYSQTRSSAGRFSTLWSRTCQSGPSLAPCGDLRRIAQTRIVRTSTVRRLTIRSICSPRPSTGDSPTIPPKVSTLRTARDIAIKSNVADSRATMRPGSLVPFVDCRRMASTSWRRCCLTKPSVCSARSSCRTPQSWPGQHIAHTNGASCLRTRSGILELRKRRNGGAQGRRRWSVSGKSATCGNHRSSGCPKLSKITEKRNDYFD